MVGITLATLVLATFQSAPQLTLQEALLIAEQNAFAVRIAESDIAEARANERVAEAVLGPSAAVTGVSSWSDTRTSGGFGQNGSNSSNTISLTLRQIIDISRVNSLRVEAAEFNVKVTEYARAAALNELRGQVKAKYLNVLQAKELVVIRENAVRSSQERLAKARVRYEANAIPRFDVLRLEADLKKAEQDLIQAQGNYRIAKQDLNNLLARPIETDFEPVPLERNTAQLDDATKYVRGSLANRPELMRAEAAIAALVKNREAEQRAALPTLTLQAGHSETLDPGFGQPDRQTSASATVSVPIVTGGAIRANTQRAREQEERGKILLQQLQLAVAFEVRTAITQYETAKASYETAVLNRELAEETLRLAQLRYDEEVGLLLDVTVAQADLTAAQSAEVVALYQLKAAYAALQKAVGRDDLESLPTDEQIEFMLEETRGNQ